MKLSSGPPCFPAKVRPSQGLTCEAARDIPDLLPIKLIDQRLLGVPMPCTGVQNSHVYQMVPRGFNLGSRGNSTVDRICGRGMEPGRLACFLSLYHAGRTRPGLRRAADGHARKRAEPRPGLLRCGVGLRPRAIPPAIKTELAHEHAQLTADSR